MTTPQLTILGREAILAADDIATETVPVPEWGGAVLVRGISGKERDQFEVELIEGKGKNRDVNLRNLRAKLVAKSVVNEAGALLFGAADIDALGNKSAAALQRVYIVASRLAGLSESDVDDLTDDLGNAESAGSGSA
jgi:hypothetical protein